METIEETDSILYQVLEGRHIKGAVECVFNQFYNFEPMVQVLAPRPAPFRDLVEGVVVSAASRGLSVVAIERATGDVAGVLLADDYADPPPEGLDPGEAAPIFELLGRLHDRYVTLKPFGPREVYHAFMVAAWARYRPAGAAFGVMKGCLRLAAQRGFKRVACETTSPLSQGMVARLGFETLHKLPYTGVFEKLAPGFCALMDWQCPR